jgi:hypothetical protein
MSWLRSTQCSTWWWLAIHYRPEHNTGTHTKTQIKTIAGPDRQSEKNDEELKSERGVKVRRVQGGKRQEGRREGKESGKQAEREEEEGGGEAEQQRQEGGGEKATDESWCKKEW